jgi:proteasome lid subunit RPN8/RPN11
MTPPPPVDIDQAKNFIRAHAKACAPYECCGLIIGTGRHQAVICGRNIARDPRHTFILHPQDYAEAERRGEVLAVYHSHVDESPEPSIRDRAMSERHGLPVVILGWPADEWSVYKPTGWKPDLIGRPFLYGILDCWTLVVDKFDRDRGIKLESMAYEDEWWLKGQDLYRQHLPSRGFVRIGSPDQVDDLILMQLEAPVPNHIGIYTGDGMMLHHPPGHLSGEHPYVCDQGYYAKCTTAFYRHRTLMDATKTKAVEDLA